VILLETRSKKAFEKLRRSLSELGIVVELKTNTLDFSTFINDALQSNEIWINGRLLEEWVHASVGRSHCCDICRGSECRTVSVGGNTYEAIPEALIIRVALLAAAELLKEGECQPTCCTS
jgi:hypothetical protein